MIEFEVKAPVPADRLEALRERLGDPDAVEEHEDVYFQHPDRDFAATDEALRVSRRADRSEITYKGPKIDATTKARREIVLKVDHEPAARELLHELGFREVAVVRKSRSIYLAHGFEVALDEVPGLGAFVELERIAHASDEHARAEREALALLKEWGLGRTEPRSYLELTLAGGSPSRSKTR